MPDWKVTLLVASSSVITAVATYIIAPIVAKFLQRRRDDANVEKTEAEAETEKAQAEKIRAETRLLEIGELEDRITKLIDKSVYGASDFIEQQRSEIVELRNRISAQDHQICIMSETLNTMSAQIRRLELELEQAKMREASVHAANVKLLERIEELETATADLPDGVITP